MAEIIALTILQPYPFAIFKGFKTFECRGWRPPPSLIGRRFAIHAGLSTAKLLDPSVKAFFEKHGELWPEDLPLGAVVGTAKLVDVVEKSRDPWFRNAGEKYGWLLEEVFELPKPLPCRGKQGLWRLPEGIAAQVIDQEVARAE